jgi:hypothetical protein
VLGLRVAHVKVLFQLPAVYGLHTAQPFAYVEWYTPFGVPDLVTGLFTIRRLTRNNHVHGEIIGVDRIVCNYRLYGRNKDTNGQRKMS